MEELIPELVTGIWSVSNFVWMLGDVLWSAPEQQTPWSATPFLKADDSLSGFTRLSATVGFLIGPAIFVIASLIMAARLGVSSLATMAVHMHIVSWSLKDCFWTLELLWPALLMDALTASGIMVSSAVSVGKMQFCIGWKDSGEMVWLASASVWTLCELAFQSALMARYFAAGLSIAALALTLASGPQKHVQATAKKKEE